MNNTNPDAQETQGVPTPKVSKEQTLANAGPSPDDCYECRSCGYVYEPSKGDNRAKIAANTAFQTLPKTWRCPVCSAPQTQFVNIGAKNRPSGFQENLGYGLGVNTLTPGQKNILIFGGLALAFLFFMSLYGLK